MKRLFYVLFLSLPLPLFATVALPEPVSVLSRCQSYYLVILTDGKMGEKIEPQRIRGAQRGSS